MTPSGHPDLRTGEGGRERESNPITHRPIEVKPENAAKLAERRAMAAQAGPPLTDEQELEMALAAERDKSASGPIAESERAVIQPAAAESETDPLAAAKAQIGRARVGVDMLHEKVAAGQVGVVRRRDPIRELDEAAEVFLAMLEPAQADTIRNCASEDNVPVWALMLAAIGRNADLREIHASTINPDWLSRGAGPVRSSQMTGPMSVPVCQRCGNAMTWLGVNRAQAACCSRHGSGYDDHSPICPIRTAGPVPGFLPTLHPALPLDNGSAIRAK